LKVWRRSVGRLASLGFPLPAVAARRTPSEQRERALLRRQAEARVRHQSTDPERAAAKRAVAAFRALDSAPDAQTLARRQRAAELLDARARGDVKLNFADHPDLRPDALRRALVANPRPMAIADALDRLEMLDPRRARRLRDDPLNASDADLGWLVCQTDMAMDAVA
jgi:hypothetical protein